MDSVDVLLAVLSSPDKLQTRSRQSHTSSGRDLFAIGSRKWCDVNGSRASSIESLLVEDDDGGVSMGKNSVIVVTFTIYSNRDVRNGEKEGERARERE